MSERAPMPSGPDAAVAVLGCGYWGLNLVRNFGELGALAMVCDPSPEARARARRTAPGVEGYEDAEAALAAMHIKGVVIATPADTHYKIAMRALDSGKDVFVEKPLALTLAQGAEVVAAAEKAGRIVMVGHVLEYHPAITRLLTLVRNGDLGDLLYMYSNRVSLGKVRREENILWSFAPHDVAVLLRMVGSMPLQVTSCGGSYIQPKVADVTVTSFLFDNGVRAHIHVSWLHPFKEQRLVVIGSDKMASFDDVAKRLVLYDQRVDVLNGEPVPVRGNGEDISFPPDEPLRLECQAFLHAMSTRQPPLTDGRSGLRVLQVLEAAQRSLETNGNPVRLPAPAVDERLVAEYR
ncbi:MAG: Gfo/Idh/MocA family oxidoreductase [Chloroflexi bacterium]|nr:Gfo/Idh/MocA family oxidoreductase [Chloroflexota bacterium]